LITAPSLKRFFSTPKGLLIIILVILVAMAAPHEGLARVMPSLLGAALAAGVTDAVILRKKHKAWEFPDGAVLTALFVAMVLSSIVPWHQVAITSVAAVLSKYIFRSRWSNVFNPAALAIVASFYVFGTAQNWWGALPELPPLALVVLFATGLFIADRVNKIPMVLSFLGVYYLLFTLTSFYGNPELVAEIYRSPDLHAALFFAFFILTDPPTSPAKYPSQVVYGVIVAVTSYAFFEMAGVVYYLLAGVLIGNIYEALRRWLAASRRALQPSSIT
jgi:Na+-translocating ferredoxin:NAD+ oxidoreductase RnfD subunit